MALFRKDSIIDNGDNTSTLVTENYGDYKTLCKEERFHEQPIIMNFIGSGFLVKKNVIATAGHCIDDKNKGEIRFVFGFKMVENVWLG